MLHPFFKNYAFHASKQANSRLRNELIDQLADELQESDDYKEYVSDFHSSFGNQAHNSIRKIKVLSDFFLEKDVTNTISKESTSALTAKQIINAFLMSDDDTIESYKSFPLLTNIFLKYNTAIPSSAPCERLFSAAKHILTPFRCSLTDENFESRLLLKTNTFKK